VLRCRPHGNATEIGTAESRGRTDRVRFNVVACNAAYGDATSPARWYAARMAARMASGNAGWGGRERG
jgi:hypothetical protein